MQNIALNPCYYHHVTILSTTKAYILQWLSIADCNHCKNYVQKCVHNVSLESMFTPLTIISLVAARVLAIQRYGHSGRDDRGCKG